MNRAEHLERLAASAVGRAQFDVLVIGGGATGLGIAVEAASRGYSVGLLEARDFASGSSSRSTKLAHGGVRYLAQGDIGMVRAALLERGRLWRNAPHLVRGLEFVVPAYDWWAGPYYGIGLKLYDVLAGRLRLGKSQMISRAQTLERLPNLNDEGLRGGVVYYDGQFDDARLAVVLAQTATDLGAALVNYAPVMRFLHEGERVVGVIARDAETDREFEVRSHVVINATGVWVDELRQCEDPEAAGMLALSQGAHIVVRSEYLASMSALMVPHTDDGRVLFAVPWLGRVIIGTTDTPVAAPSLEPRAFDEELEFILNHASRYLGPLGGSDVLSIYAGLRPLVQREGKGGAETKSLSRDHTIVVSKRGLVTITGGKWTTYRKMAEDALDRALQVANLELRPSVTANLLLHGAVGGDEMHFRDEGSADGFKHGFDEQGIEWQVAARLSAYGSDAPKLQVLIAGDPTLGEVLHPRLPYLKAMVVWAVRNEMARSLEDVLVRRTRSLTLDARAALEIAPMVAELIARELGRDEAWQEAELARFRVQARVSLWRQDD